MKKLTRVLLTCAFTAIASRPDSPLAALDQAKVKACDINAFLFSPSNRWEYDKPAAWKNAVSNKIEACTGAIESTEIGDSRKQVASIVAQRGVYYKILGDHENTKSYSNANFDRSELQRVYDLAISDLSLSIRLTPEGSDYPYDQRSQVFMMLRMNVRDPTLKIAYLKQARSDEIKAYAFDHWETRTRAGTGDKGLDKWLVETAADLAGSHKKRIEDMDREIRCLSNNPPREYLACIKY